jgi:hypothetical protein
MANIYTNLETLKNDYGVMKLKKILELIEEAYKLEIKNYKKGTKKYKEIEKDFKDLINSINKDIPLNEYEEKIILFRTFDIIIDLEKKDNVLNNHLLNNVTKERLIEDRITFFYYEVTLAFFYIGNNVIDVSLKKEAEELFKNLSLFNKKNFFNGEI